MKTSVLFVCHGNICRSTMAEFVFKKMIKDARLEQNVHIESAATSREEIGNDIHPGTKQKLREMNIPFERHYARQITKDDYDSFDYLIGMDRENLFYMNRMWNNDPEHKIYNLLEFAGKDRDISDPWYTGNFDDTWNDVHEGCSALLEKIICTVNDSMLK